MKKVLGYLKYYIIPALLCLILLFGEAFSDLSLPSLMSDMVNVGIQQNGIESPTPKIISIKDFDLIAPFMTEDNKSLFDENFEKIAEDSDKAAEYKKDFSKSDEESFYALKTSFSKLDDNKKEELDSAFSSSIISFLTFLQDIQPDDAEQKDTITTEELSSFDFDQLYGLQPQIDAIPPEVIQQYNVTADKYDDMIKVQVSLALTKQVYVNMGANTDSLRDAYVWNTGFKMIIITLLGAIATILVSLLASRIGTGVARKLREDVFTKIESFSSNEMDKLSTASLITRTTNDIVQIQDLFVMLFRFGLYSPIMAIGGVLMAVNKSVSMSWIIAAAVLFVIGVISVVFAVSMPKFKSLQKIIDKLNLVTRERLSGTLVIRAFGTQKFEEERFEEANHDLSNVFLFINRLFVILMPMMNLIIGALSLTIVWVGARQIEQSQLQIGDMMAFSQYAMQILFSFIMIASIFFMIPRASVSGGRIAEILNTELVIKDPETPIKTPDNPKGLVEFKNVSFSYGGAEEEVLHNISFTAKPGETTAFIGSTGSGKSTLVNLIPRFYDVTEGEILVDGADVRKYSQKDLRDIIGYIPQQGILFSGDIASNLRYGKEDATEQEMYKAIEIAQAAEFVSSSNEGLSLSISQGGSNVSGGQRQRLSIARALTKQAPIYIFDDSFSALDFKTDAMLRKSLRQNTKDSTLLIVAQRVGTIINAEQIIVLNEGSIIGKGTHRELLKTCDIYREIAQSQLTKEELDE